MGNISSDKNTRTAEGRKDIAVRCVPKFVNTFREGAKGTERATPIAVVMLFPW